MENTTATLGDIGKLIGARWKALGVEDTASWQARAVEEKEAYEQSLASFLASGGVLPDKSGGSAHGHASGETVIPVVRVRRLLKSLDLEMGTVASEAAFLITSATELFLQLLASDAVEVLRGSAGGKRKTLTSLDITRAIAGNPAMAFLRPDFPLPTPSQLQASRQSKAAISSGGGGEMDDGAKGGGEGDALAPQPPRGAIFVALERQAALAAELATKAGGVSSRWRGEGGASPPRASSERGKGVGEEGEEEEEELEEGAETGKTKSKGSSGMQRKRLTTGKRRGVRRGVSTEGERGGEREEDEEGGLIPSAPTARGKGGSKREGGGNPLDKFVVRMTSADEAKTFWSESFAKGELKDISEGNPADRIKIRGKKGKGGKKGKSGGRGSRSWGDEGEEGGGDGRGEDEGVVDLGALRKSFGVAPRRPARSGASLKRGGKKKGGAGAAPVEEDEGEGPDVDDDDDEGDEDGDGEEDEGGEEDGGDEEGVDADDDIEDSGGGLDGRVEAGSEEEEEEGGGGHVTVLPPQAPSQPPSNKRKLDK